MEKDSPRLPPNSKWHGLEGTSWASLQSTGTDGSRIAFYTVYERVATKYDNDLVGGHNKNLNVVLATAALYFGIAARLALSGRKRKLNMDDQSAGIDAAAPFLYASTIIFILTAISAIWAKRDLSSYLVHKGESLIERCRDRQRKFDALQEWRFDSLPNITLLTALALLACGFSKLVCYRDLSVSYVHFFLAMPGVVVYSKIACAPIAWHVSFL